MPAVPHQLHPLVSLGCFLKKGVLSLQELLWGSYCKRGTIYPET
jgi:hypothetical protein